MMFVVFGKSSCPACVRAKLHLEKSQNDFLYFDIEETPNALSVLRGLVPDVKTVPQIFLLENSIESVEQMINAKYQYVGGFNDLTSLDFEGAPV